MTSSQPGRKRLKAVAIAIAIVLLIVLLLFLLLRLLFPKFVPEFPLEPQSQPADCTDVQVLSVPGTWESIGNDDPYNPWFNPNALLLTVTRPLQERYQHARADVFTVPYIAQFSNPVALPPDGQATYKYSRDEGRNRTIGKMKEVADHCPLTNFILVGFSQGAVIAGDIAADIGAGRGPVASKRVLGVMLIADGRRIPGQATPLGANPPGVGAEVALKLVGPLTAITGVSLRGERKEGFGDLAGRTFSICAPGDLICDAPTGANPMGALNELLTNTPNVKHAMYASYVLDEASGLTAPQWTLDWMTQLIEAAPTPKHS